ncbi:ubiquitin-protein transferase activating protein [Actinomortierella wolfii]|nr:ubiquitin-protein transferase activating protein [Actinomortierella wolfii]
MNTPSASTTNSASRTLVPKTPQRIPSTPSLSLKTIGNTPRASSTASNIASGSTSISTTAKAAAAAGASTSTAAVSSSSSRPATTSLASKRLQMLQSLRDSSSVSKNSFSNSALLSSSSGATKTPTTPSTTPTTPSVSGTPSRTRHVDSASSSSVNSPSIRIPTTPVMRPSAVGGILASGGSTPLGSKSVLAKRSFSEASLSLSKSPSISSPSMLVATNSTKYQSGNAMSSSAGISSQPRPNKLARVPSIGHLPTKLDVVTHDWKSAPIKKDKKITPQGDRFIPSRSHNHIASAQAKLDLAKDQETGSSSSESSQPASIAYQEQLAEACGLTLDKRILAFNVEAPSSDRDSMWRKHSQRSGLTRSMTDVALARRRILSTPDKILDAPGLLDDYYLHLLDWSCNNQIAIGLGKSVYIWDGDTGDVHALCTFTGADDWVASLAWAEDGAFLAIGTFDGDAQIWDVEQKTKIRSMTGHQARIGVMSWDKAILSSGCRDGSIWNHDVRVPNHKVAELLHHTNEVCGLSWRADGLQLASGGNDNIVNIWDPRNTAVPKFTKTDHQAAVKALAWCPWQNSLLATGGGTRDQMIYFWNTATGARVNSVNTESQVTSILWSSEYREFVSSHGYPDYNLSVYSYPSLSKVSHIVRAHESRVLHTALSPDGQVVATLASDDALKFWKIFEQRKVSKASSSGGGLKRTASFSSGSDPGLGGSGGGGIGGSHGGISTIKGKTSLSSMTTIR